MEEEEKRVKKGGEGEKKRGREGKRRKGGQNG
jgi:hypothetical protein